MKSTVLILVCITITTGLYVDHGDPYKSGTLTTGKVVLTVLEDNSPLHAVAYYPNVTGEYGVVFFIPGLDGVILSAFYSEYLTAIAQHGFVVVASDYIFPALDNPAGYHMNKEKLGSIADKYMEQFYWLKSNLQRLIQAVTPGVNSSWDHVALLSHSAGADAMLKMTERNHTLFQAVVFWEPFSYQFTTKTNYSLPALITGTSLSTKRAIIVPCIIAGYGFNHFYDMWGEPPKVLVDAKDFGHCDLMDYAFRDFCIDTKTCLGGNASMIPAYHQYTQGITSGFLIAYLQGYSQTINYVIDQTKIPLPLEEFKYNMSAPSYKHLYLP